MYLLFKQWIAKCKKKSANFHNENPVTVSTEIRKKLLKLEMQTIQKTTKHGIFIMTNQSRISTCLQRWI